MCFVLKQCVFYEACILLGNVHTLNLQTCVLSQTTHLFYHLQQPGNNMFRKARGTYRFSHQALEKEGVILETPGIPEQR